MPLNREGMIWGALLVSLERARWKIDSAAFGPPSSIRVGLIEGLQKPAAQDLVSSTDLPRRSRSAMDGFAFSYSDLLRFGRLRVSAELFPSTGRPGRLKRGEAAYVATGAPIPERANTVARVESCKVNGHRLTVLGKVRPGKDIQERGKDLHKGEVVVERGEPLTPYHIDVLSSIGLARVRVFRVRMALMAIGDELTTFTEARTGDNSDSISAMIIGLAGFADVGYRGVLGDDRARISVALRDAAASADMVVTIGGTSMGKLDFTKKAVAAEGELLFEGVSVNTLKRAGVGMVSGKPVVMLPGQVVSAAVSFHEHGLHVASRLVGRELRKYEEAKLAEDLEVTHNMDSVYLFDVKDGEARPLPWGVGLHKTLLKANAFGVVKRHALYAKGSALRVQKLVK